MSDLGERLVSAFEDALVKMVATGEFMRQDYSAKIPLEIGTLRSIYAKVDINRVTARVLENVEIRMADQILNSMATELATDVKQVLSNKELREDIRSMIRDKIRAAANALKEPTSA